MNASMSSDGEPRKAALLLRGFSAYNNFDTFFKMVARTLEGQGLDVLTINLRDNADFMSDMNKALAYTSRNIVAAFTLNGVGTQLGGFTKDSNIWWRFGIPIVSWMGDHPCYYLARHQHQTPASMILYEYKDFSDFHRDHVRSRGRVAYVPFGVWDLGRPARRRQARKGEPPLIIFPKSAWNPAELEAKWSELPRATQVIIRNAVEDYQANTARSGPVSFSVLRAADAVGLELRCDLNLFCFFIAQVDDYMRRVKVAKLVREMLPYPVRIYGEGMGFIDAAGARAAIMPPIDYEQLVDLYYEADAIVTMNPNVDDECHDRVYSAFGTGALPITDINPWWEKNHAPLLPYSYDFRDRPVGAALDRFLANPETAYGIAWEQRETACRRGTFAQTVIEALELAALHKHYTFNFEAPQPGYVKPEE